MRDTLIQLRKIAGMTQKQVANKVDISRSFYGHIETGARNPSYGLAKKIAELFNEKVDSIFFNSNCFRVKQEASEDALSQ